jgi:predicted MFS family arabinose efflux permease
VFAFRIPVALLALALSPRIASARPQTSMREFDVLGALLLVAWLSALLLAVACAPGPFATVVPYGLSLLGAAAFAVFCRHELRSPHPLLRLSLFGHGSFALLNTINVLASFAAFSVLLLVPYYLVRIAGLDALSGGAVLAVSALGTVLGASLAGRLSRHLPIGALALSGLVLNIAGLWGISRWGLATPLAQIAAALLAQGIGMGLFQVGYSDYVTGALPAQDRGVAGSLTMLTRTIGVVLAATGLSAAFAHFEAGAARAVASGAAAFLAGFQTTLSCVSLGLAAAVALTLLRPRTWRLGP